MALSSELISQFVKTTKDDTKKSSETTVYGTVVYDGRTYVRLDGAPDGVLTPVSTTASVQDGERVMVMIKDHTATVTGNISKPSARDEDVEKVSGQLDDLSTKAAEFDVVIAHKVTADDIQAVNGMFTNITAITGKYSELEAITADIENLKAKIIEGETLRVDDIEAITATIESIEAKFGGFTEIETDDLEAINAEITNLKGYTADFTYISAVNADVRNLKAVVINAETGKFKFADIDFANIGAAAIENLFTESGMIGDLVMSDGRVTGTLVGVTIKGDLIEGNTVVADKLVVRGEDGLYYKLNMLGIGSNATTRYVKTDVIIDPAPDGTVVEGASTSTLEQVYEYVSNGNLFDKDTMVTVGSWWKTEGTQCVLQSTVDTGSYGAIQIPVVGIKKVTISIPSATYDILFYNYFFIGDDDTIIETGAPYAKIGPVNSYTVVVPEGARELRASLSGYKQLEAASNFPMVVAGDTPKPYEPYGPTVTYYTIVDGICYAVDLSSSAVSIEQTDYNSLNGSVITAKSITAEKIHVDDLQAFGATIGGFILEEHALHSLLKDDIHHASAGVYMDTNGQFAVGNDTNFLRFYKDENDEYRLDISAARVQLASTSKNIEDAFSDIEQQITDTSDNLQDELNRQYSNYEAFLNKFSKYIRFMEDENGNPSDTAMTIGSGDSVITLEIDNEKGLIFKKNGVKFGSWDGTNFHTGNIVVDVQERAQFGNFAFIPRSDGSLSFLKVGG